VDTCIWSLVLRRRATITLSADEQKLAHSLSDAIRDGRVAMIGPIRQEILSGVKEPGRFDKLSVALSSFPDEALTTSDYLNAARLFNLCRSRGVECGPVDILICAVAEQRNWTILTSDQALKRCLGVIQSSK
jgi:predicted nucleic acid-binding protein